MTNDLFDPLKQQDATSPIAPTAMADNGAAHPDSPAAFYDPLREAANRHVTPDLSGRIPVSFDTPEDPTVVKFGSTADPMQLDMDPFGNNTVEWGKVNGEALGPSYVKSANILGKAFTREQLEATEKGRKIIELMEDDRNGHRRSFWDAIKPSAWGPSDIPFIGMFAAVGKSIEDGITVHNALKKIMDGEPLTDDEALSTRLYMAEQEHMSKGTWGATVGDIVRAAPGFMFEFWGSSKVLGGVRGIISGAADGSPKAAARLSIDRATKYATRDAVKTSLENALEGATRYGYKKTAAGIVDVAAGTVTEGYKPIIAETKDAAMSKVLPMYVAKFGTGNEMAKKVAAARIEHELGAALAMNAKTGGPAFARWARGTYEAAKDHASRALLDFGNFGTEAYSASGRELGSAMKTLGQAAGILGIEAPIRGGLVMLPQMVGSRYAYEAIYGRKPVTSSQLSLEASAVREGNKELMADAEAYALGLNFLEYASENSGAGFGKLFRAAGLKLFGAKAMGVAIEGGTEGLIPRGLTEAAGSRMRTWINKAVGTTDDFLRGHLDNQVAAVKHKLGLEITDHAADDAIRTFVSTGDKSVLGEMASAVGDNPSKFIRSAVKEAIESNRLDMTYRGFTRYVLADIMARNKWGPQELTNWLKTAGYDGIVEEMMEERYSDFVTGLFGWDDRASKDKGFVKNIEQAFRNLNPGWEQLTAEAVGFAVPLGVRTAIFQIQKAAGGSDLAYVQNYTGALNEFRGANYIVEAEADTHFRVAEESIAHLRDQLAKSTDEDEKADLQKRIDIAQTQFDRQASVRGAAGYNAEQILAFEAPNTRGDDSVRETPTSDQAKRGVDAKNVLVEGSFKAAEALARSRAGALDPAKMSFAKRAVSRIAGFMGGLVTGSLSMAMYDPTAWSMVDRGFNRNVVEQLADAYDKHFMATKSRLIAENAKAVEQGTRSDVQPTNDEIRKAMREGCEKETQAIMRAYLAAQGVRIFSAGEMRDQARRVVREKYGVLDGHEGEIEETRQKIAEYTLRLLADGGVQTADVRKISRGIINLSDENPFADDVILDATMRLSGFQGLEETCELRPDTDLQKTLRGRSLPGGIVSRVAGIDLKNVTDEDAKIISDVATRLGYVPRTSANGKFTTAFSEEAIERLNERVVDLCKKAMACANRNIRTYRLDRSVVPELGGGRVAVSPFLRVSVTRAGFTWTDTLEDGTTQKRTVATETELQSEMLRKGYVPANTEIVFTPAREIRTKDPAVMLDKLGLVATYLRASLKPNATKEDLVDNPAIHPAFRYKRVGDTLRKYTIEEEQEAAAQELAEASKYRSVMSMSDADKMAAFKQGDEGVEATLARLAKAELSYKNVFGSEQEKNGYLNKIDKILSAHGVELPGFMNRSYSSLLAGQHGYYTLSTRLLTFNEGSAFVLVDLNHDADYDGPLMSRAITNGFMAYRSLWSYNPETKRYPAFATVLRDIVKRLDRVASELAKSSDAAGRRGEADAMRELADQLVGGTNLESPKLDTIVWLARNAVLGQAERESRNSRSTTTYAAASARLAAALRQTPEFYPFLGLVDICLGGNGFADTKNAEARAEFGVAALARAFSGNDGYSPADLLKNGMLPEKADGTRMSVPEFMDKVNAAIAFINKKGEKVDVEALRKAAESDPMTFVSSLMRSAKLRTPAELKDFMQKVLVAAGISAGYTADLSNWQRDLERSAQFNAQLRRERDLLEREIALKDAELAKLKADANASSAEIQALSQERDDLVAELNALLAEQDGGKKPVAANPLSPEVPVGEPSDDPKEPTKQSDPAEFGPENSGEGGDVDIDDLNADGEGDGMKSWGKPNSTVRVPTKDENGNQVGETEPEGPAATMSPEARRHLVWTAMAALSARGMSTAEHDVKAIVREMFQCISDEDLDAVFSDFNSFLELNVKDGKVREDANNAFLALKEYLDDEGKNISDNEGFNDKAVAAYNSLKPFLEMMEAAVPLTKRNFQGLVNVLREEVDEFILEADSAVAKTTADLPARFQDDDLRSAYAMVGALLNPRNISKYVESVKTKSVPESLALHSAICKKVLHGGGSIIDAMIAKFLAPVKTEAGIARPEANITRPENAHLAAFLSFLRSLTNAGTRESLMLLVSSSVNCDAVAMDDVYEFVEDKINPYATGTSKKTGNLLINDSVTTRGSVSVNMASAAFMPFVGMLPSRITDIGIEFSRITGACVKDLQPMAYAGHRKGAELGFLPTEVEYGKDEAGMPKTKKVLTGIPRTMLLQDLETFRHNAGVIAKAIADVFGRNNPLSKMLTSPMLFNSFRTRILRGDDVQHMLRLRTYFNKFAPVKGKRPEALDVLGSVIYELSLGKDRVTRDSVINTVQIAFTTGNLLKGNIGYPGASARTTDEWYTMLNEFTQAMPDTVVPSKSVPGRGSKGSSVAVAAPGPVPIVLRYMTMESDGPMAFRTLCEKIVREDAERDYWIDYGRRTGRYVNPNAALGDDFGFRKDEADAKTAAVAGLKAFVDKRIENELGGLDAIVGRCIQTMTWPDAAATPIMARNLSVDYSPVELGRACQYSYDGGKNGANADKNKMWYLPLFGGDHACNNLLQIPTRRPVAKNGEPLMFVEAAKAVNDEVGITLMLTDTKRSAITSADAPSVPMVGARVEFTDDLIPSVKSAKFGECRLHVSLNLASEGIKPDGKKDHPYSQEAMHGMTICAGVGPDALRRMSKDPKLRIQKFHCIGTGAMLEFEKSASSVVDPDSLRDGGAYPPGTMARAYADHIIKYRGNGRDTSSDTITDEDSYKVGPLKSKIFGIANVVEDGSVVGKPKMLLSFIKEKLEAGMKPDAIMELEVTTAHRRGNVWSADTVEENGKKKVAKIKLSEALDGLEIVEMEGLHPGKRGVDQGFAISYRDNTMLALKVANIAHSARPHVGTNGKNYTIDAMTKAIEQMFRNGGKLTDDANGTQNQVVTTLNSYAIVSSAVATDARSVEAALKEDPQLAALVRGHADPDGMEYRKLRAEIVAKRIREAVLSPIQKVDAVLTSCGATLEPDGMILDHSTSQMRRDVHKGSICFADDEITGDGLFRGFKRRLALAEVNVKSVSFRYGMFLDDTSENFSKLFDATDDESLMRSMERNLRGIRDADSEYARLLKERGQEEAFRAWKKEKMIAKKRGREFYKPEPPESEALTNARTVRNTFRRMFLSCFIDHHGTRMDEKLYETKTGGRAFYWNSMCFEDLFVNPDGNGSRFDRTAFYTGSDMIACDVYDFETGVKDETKSRPKMMFLAGSAFGNPRTPSYNGGMWLQVSRASFPVSEEFNGESFVVGEDALVALDPQALDIEGCDNDGDESALYMLSPDEHGVCVYGDIETCLPADDPNDSRYANWDHSFASNAALENDDNRRKMLEAAMEPKLGFPYVAKMGDGFAFTKLGQRAVSNQLVQGLIDMAHQLAVPEGTERRNFASTISGRTKAQPFDDASFWKKQSDEDPAKYAGIVRVMDVMPPDVFANEDDTIGNYRVQEQVSLSAKKSSMARGAIVSAASALHVAFMSGAFGKRPDGNEKNKFQLFNETDFTPEKWQAFARHFDGLSNATFDDVKERICKRLGLTPEMVDVLVCDLLSRDKVPTTDEDWHKALIEYVMSVRDRTPDGKSVLDASKRECVLTMSTNLDGTDHSRLFMMKVSDQFDSTWAKVFDSTFFKGAKPVSLRETFLSKLGLRVGDNGFLTKAAGHETAAGRIAEWFMRMTPDVRGYVIEACSERGYHNDLSGYLLWLTGAACGNLQNVADGRTVDLAQVDTVLAKYGAAFVRYAEKRRAWKTAKGFAKAVNYAQADPGAPDARSRMARAEKDYSAVMSECWDHLSADQRRTIIDMRQATKMAYSCGMVNAEKPESRAFNALAAVKEDCSADDDLLSAMQARNSSCVSDLRDVLGVIKDCNNDVELMDSDNTEGLRDNITSIPYVIAALQCLPKSGFTKDYKTTKAVMTAIADAGFNLPEVRPLGFRRSVESMFSVLYALMSTSVEGLEHPGITYLGGRSDRAFSLNDKAATRRSNRKVSNYGIGEETLMTIFQTFSARDEASLARIREAIGAIIQGAFDGKARTHRNYDNQRKYAANNAKSFELSLANLDAILRDSKDAITGEETEAGELTYSWGVSNSHLRKAVRDCKRVIIAMAKAVHADEKKFSVRPSEFFKQILPVYMAMTAPVAGTPSYEKFSSSILATMPELYGLWSHRQAANDRAFDFMRRKYMAGNDGAFGIVDALSVINFGPVDVGATYAAMQAAKVDPELFQTILRDVRLGGRAAGVRAVRSNPENRTLVDLFAYDGVLFKAASIHDEFSREKAFHEGQTPLVSVVNAQDATPPVAEQRPDATLAQLVEGVRRVLGATQGLDVSVEGNTMFIRGQISGDKALERRKINAPVNTVIRVDLCPSGFGNVNTDLNSMADATSITSALRQAGILDISPRDFLERLTYDERRKIVETYLPDCAGKSAEGVALRSPQWSIGADGLLTLSGAIKLRKAEDRVLYHEYFHAMVGMMRSLGMFSGGEAAALAKTYGKARGDYELFDEEAAADKFADFVAGKKAAAAKSGVAAFFQKLLDLIRSLLSVMKNKGFRYNEDVSTSDTRIAREDILFNMVLSGTVMDSLDSARLVSARLSANHRAAADIAEAKAMERLDTAVSRTYADRFHEEPNESYQPPKAWIKRASMHLAESLEKGTSPQDAVDALILYRGGTVSTSATERGGDAVEVVPTMTDLSSEIANKLGDAVSPGTGIDGNTSAEADRMQQLGHGIAQAIAKGLDAIDPSVKAILESGSDLSKIHLSQEIYDVVTDGVFSAADSLGVDLKAKDQHLKNLVYANMLHLYSDLSNRLGFGGKSKNPINLAREHKGNFVRQKEHVSSADVSAFLLTAGGLSYADIARDTMDRLGEIYANTDNEQLKRCVNHLMVNLTRIINKTGYKGDPVHEIVAGVKFGKRNVETGRTDACVEDVRVTTGAGARNRRMYMFNNPLFQEAINLAAKTAFTLSSAKSLYNILGIIPESLTGKEIPGGRGIRVRPVNRRSFSLAFDGPKKTTVMPDGSKLNFSERGHVYFMDTKDGRVVLPSCTEVIGSFTNKFDAVAVSERMRYTKEAAEELRKEWKDEGDRTSARGTLIHSVYEDVLMGRPVRAKATSEMDRTMIERAVKIAENIKRDYDILGTEVMVCDRDSMVAGTIDVVARNKRTGRLTLIDHKTSKYIGVESYKGQMMLNGLGHLKDSKFNRYALQLNVYRELLRRGGAAGIAIGENEPIDLAINLYNGYSDAELRRFAQTAKNVYGEDPSVVVRERWYPNIPSMESEAATILDYAKDNHDALVDTAVADAVIPAPLPNSEVVAALGISLEDLLADNRVIDPFAEVGLYVNNPGEWLASTIRQHFGGKALRDMFQEEHRKLKGVTDKFRRVQNWWAMYLGENAVEDTKLLAVRQDRGHFVFDNGSVQYDETGHERVGFRNYNRRIAGTARGVTVDVTLDREDKEVIDFWLKSAYATAMGDKFMLTGVDGLYFDAKDLTKGEGQRWTYEDFARDKVMAAYNGSRVGRIKTRAHIMLAQLLSGNQLPDFVVNGDMKLYDRMVKGLVDSMNSVYDAMFESGSGVDPADTNDLVLKSLARKGLVKYVVDRKGKAVRGTVAISADEIDRAFVNSNAYKKLVKAGRDPVMLTREKLHEAVVGARRELDKVVKSSPWMAFGDGRHFNSFGSHMMLFKGSGVFMYWANRIGRDEKKSVAERLNEYESSFVQTLKAEDQSITSAQTSMLADLFETEETSQSLRDAIRKGEYAQGSRKAERTGLVIEAADLGSSHKVAEIIYRRLNEMAWDAEGHRKTVDRLGGRGSVARMIDMYEQLVGERTSWGCMGLSAEQAYQINGELPANYQIFHAMNIQLEDAARTMQFRNTFVNFLFTTDEHGMPVSYAKPSLTNAGYADDGIPEQVWEYAARWWAECNGRKYDESVSGRVNAARLYDEIITANETKTVAGRHFRQLDGDVRQGLTSVSDFAAVDDDAREDDVNARNALNGGETYGYAKMLFNIRRVVGGKAQSLLMQRVANYSKTLSVQQSAFFPIATKIESSAAAVGLWTMVASNFTPKLARKMDKAIAGFDKVFRTNFGDTLNRNFIGFKDIIEMMDTDDPFLADAINLCDDLGISLSDRLVNPYESDKAIVQADMMKIVELVKRSGGGDKAAAAVKSMLDGFLFRGSERAFSYALNATKIATVLQLAQKVRRKCHDSGRAFNFANEMRPYAAYLNAEIGGIDPLRYAWADPRFRRMMNAIMFSWEWTKGAWAAGGGEIFEEAFGGGHFTNPETRAHMMGRWLRMYGSIMIGVPAIGQALNLAMARIIGYFTGYSGDDDDKWFTWENEEKHNLSAFDITPLLRAIGKSELVLGAKEIPVVGHLIPAYTGKDKYNTTGKRRYYMHFGKQGWEFFRWFTAPEKQFLSKLSMPLQRMMEGLLGYNMASREYDLPFSKMSFAERWLNPTLDGAWWNLAKAFVPFSWNAMSSYGDAGALSILGPVSMGTSYMAAIKDTQSRLTAWAKNDRRGYSFGYPNAKSKKRNAWIVADILADAKRNGMDPNTILSEATGLAAKTLYSQLYDALPKEENADFDVREVARIVRGLRRLNVVQKQLFQSMGAKLERHGKPWRDMTPLEKAQFRAAVKSAMMNPYTVDPDTYRAYLVEEAGLRGILGTRQASKGGAALSNFLATDKVPDTLFGFPVVKDNYEERDLAFFKAYPEAGGYYDMEDGNEGTEPTDTPPPTDDANKQGEPKWQGS